MKDFYSGVYEIDDDKSLKIVIDEINNNPPGAINFTFRPNENQDLIINSIAAIITKTSISNLNLSEIIEERVKEVVDLLIDNTTVRKLNLQYNHINDEEAQHIENLLIKNHSITSLDMRYNKIKSAGMDKIIHGLKNNYIVTSLILSPCEINNQNFNKYSGVEMDIKVIKHLLYRNREYIYNLALFINNNRNESSYSYYGDFNNLQVKSPHHACPNLKGAFSYFKLFSKVDKVDLKSYLKLSYSSRTLKVDKSLSSHEIGVNLDAQRILKLDDLSAELFIANFKCLSEAIFFRYVCKGFKSKNTNEGHILSKFPPELIVKMTKDLPPPSSKKTEKNSDIINITKEQIPSNDTVIEKTLATLQQENPSDIIDPNDLLTLADDLFENANFMEVVLGQIQGFDHAHN